MGVLPVAPQLLGFGIILSKSEACSAVLLSDLLHYGGGFFERSGSRSLELKEKAVLLGVFTRGHAKLVDGGNKNVVYQLDTFCKVDDFSDTAKQKSSSY